MPSSSGNVLIADDDVLVSTPLRKILVGRGYRVTCVENGWDAAKALATGEFDLLISDIRMPGNMGLDVLHADEVRALQVPVILITGYPTVETAIDALRLSVVDYILKPIQPDALLTSVARAVERKRALRTVREIESRVGQVTAMLQSVKSTLDTAGTPLLDLDRHVRTSGSSSDQSMAARLLSDEFSALSPREREILMLIAEGQNAIAVAASLEISVSTVRNHLKSVYRKIGVTSQVALVRKLLA